MSAKSIFKMNKRELQAAGLAAGIEFQPGATNKGMIAILQNRPAPAAETEPEPTPEPQAILEESPVAIEEVHQAALDSHRRLADAMFEQGVAEAEADLKAAQTRAAEDQKAEKAHAREIAKAQEAEATG